MSRPKNGRPGRLAFYCDAVSCKANGSASTYTILKPAGLGQAIRFDVDIAYR